MQIQEQNNNNNNNKLWGHLVHLFFSLHILSTSFAVSVYTLHSLILLFFSYSFLSMTTAGCPAAMDILKNVGK
jgi:hypothetical protein